MPLNPIITQFASKLRQRTALLSDRNSLEAFIKGPKATDEDRAKGAELIAEYEALGQQAKAGLPKPGPVGPVVVKPPTPRPNADAADPIVLGSPFHNPYTFIPFPSDSEYWLNDPTLLTADEVDTKRFTGVLTVRVRALSPILSCEPRPDRSSGDQRGAGPTARRREALRCGGRLIVPATGVRGALRHLMVVLTGGTLDRVSANSWLCQGRDTQLGPCGPQSPEDVPDHCFLAMVERRGTETRPGVVRLNALRGQDVLIEVTRLAEHGINETSARPRQGESRGCVKSSKDPSLWIKLSGNPVNKKGKREGLFRASDRCIELPPRLWAEYAARHRHADFGELKDGDLVWLQHRNPGASQISDPSDVVSIQWSRWGRTGRPVSTLLGKARSRVLPMDPDLVDRATDLFGFIGADDKHFRRAGRIRPDNLVFDKTAKVVPAVELAAMAQPHPGCIAFYRDIDGQDDLDTVNVETPLRGYKVYRTTKERGAQAPWLYKNQGIYDKGGALKPFDPSELTCRCDLIDEGAEGTLTLSLRSLAPEELSILLAMCGVDWRLGGGKPLGLGHCRPVHVELHDEAGERILDWDIAEADPHVSKLDRPAPTPVSAPHASFLDAEFNSRLRIYQITQRPVAKLRYPRWQVDGTRGGHAWFQRVALPKKGRSGLQVLSVTGRLRELAKGKSLIRAQPLPKFDPADIEKDVLYGHDIKLVARRLDRGTTADTSFDLAEDGSPTPPPPARGPEDSKGPNRETRKAQRTQRDRP